MREREEGEGEGREREEGEGEREGEGESTMYNIIQCTSHCTHLHIISYLVHYCPCIYYVHLYKVGNRIAIPSVMLNAEWLYIMF